MKQLLLLTAAFSLFGLRLSTIQAQDSVFSYTHQGTTLYYVIDSNQQAMVVPPLYPNWCINPVDSMRSTWYGYIQPTGVVTIPDTVSFAGNLYPVTCIGVDAFFRCDSITEAYVPPTVARLDTGAFCNCSALQSVELSEGLIDIGDYAFQATALHSVTLPGTVQRVGYFAFTICDSLYSVTLNEGLQVIDVGGFMCNPILTTINFPSTLTAINAFAFQDDSLLASDIVLPEGLTTLEDVTFDGCSNIQNVYIPGTVDRIGADAFSRCRSLQSVTLGAGVSVIGDAAFSRCRSLQSVTLGAGVSVIGNYAFEQCTKLMQISFPSTLTRIECWAFSEDSSLSEVILPEGFSSLGIAAFQDCTELRHVSLPGTLDSIGIGAFMGCISLDTLIIPDNVRYMGNVAMALCSNLKICHLPEQLDRVNGWLLWGTALEEVVVPSNVTFIDTSAFSGCLQLHKVTLPASLTSMAEYIFIDGTLLDTIVLLSSTPPTAYDNDFTDYTATLVVPCGTESAYRQHPVWGQFQNIVENCNGINDVEDDDIKVYARDGRIVVEGAEGEAVQVFDIMGRPINPEHTIDTGIYLVKVGNRPSQKVVVLK